MSGKKIINGLQEATEYARNRRMLVGFNDGQWFVLKAGSIVAGPFSTSQDAWHWLEASDANRIPLQ